MNTNAPSPSAQSILVSLACPGPRCPCHIAEARGHGDTHCPCHDDRRPSLGVKEENGKILIHCGAGCASEAVIAELVDRGLWPARAQGLTLDDLARAKRLSRTFLESIGVREIAMHGKPRVQIDYPDEHGQVQAVRYRIGLDPHGPRFLWRRGDTPILYGLPRLREFAQQQGFVLFVEGESDTWTGWRFDLPVIGIPGKTSWRDEWAAPFRQRHIDAYLWMEPDAQGLLGKIADSLPGVRVVFAPPGIKDLSEAHLQGQDVRALIHRLIESAPTAADALREIDERRREAAAAEALKQCGDLLGDPRLLDRIGDALAASGLAGDLTNAKIVELAIVSRVTNRPVNLVVAGPSAAGKNFLVTRVLALHPAEAVYELTASSERLLAFTDEDLRHRVVLISEAAGLHRDGIGATLMREIVWSGKLRYATIQKTQNGLQPLTIEKPGPISLVTTSTRDLDAELATRMLTITVPDDPGQTRAIVREAGRRAAGTAQGADLAPFVAAHRWLAAAGGRDVVIPFAEALAELVDPGAVRVRRDFVQLLALIRACAILHQRQRPRDRESRIVAVPDDYRTVHSLAAEVFGAISPGGLTVAQREAVEAVHVLCEATGATVSYQQVADRLGIDVSSTYRRLRKPLAAGFVVNDEERERRPARLRPGETPPGPRPALPDPGALLHALGGRVFETSGIDCKPANAQGEPLGIKAPGFAAKVDGGDGLAVQTTLATDSLQGGTANPQPLENMGSRGQFAGLHSVQRGSSVPPSPRDGQSGGPDTLPSPAAGTPVNGEDLPSFPQDDGERRWAMAVGRAFNWPKVEIGRGESIAPGERYWHLFFTRCSEDQLARALAALQALDGAVPGDPDLWIPDDTDDVSLGAVPADALDYAQREEGTS